ncbi:hypothetical protein H114_00792 [Streptomyces gancidicus BKS 13-15]|uniref:Uncharacterized protein n=1 Tax=Streptomyces gancidicus BKS 13-15 TaxID=1284664 RepID=M3EDG6_STREZ|nr:hypothetical protein [Streptomyces gancidicus]EMF31121.1 hypothetical protein H114_00792 [Streptomyces gancidicus BKS 13-15]
MTTAPAEHCGPACSEAHTYRLGDCALASTPVHVTPPAAEHLPAGLLASATAGAAMLDAAAHGPRLQNLLAHALIQLARDGWIRYAPGDGFDPVPEHRPATAPEPAPLVCVCGTDVDWLFHTGGSGWIHVPGSDTNCTHVRPRCPECQMPHALLPDEPPLCRSVRRRDDEAATEATGEPLMSPEWRPGDGHHRCPVRVGPNRWQCVFRAGHPPHGHTTSSSNPGSPMDGLLPPGVQAAPGTLTDRLFAVVRYLLGDGPWDVVARHIADACTAEALRPERPARRGPDLTAEQRRQALAVLDEQQPRTGGGFRYTGPDGGRLVVTPTRRRGQPAVKLRGVPADGGRAAVVDVPADQVEDVIAGMRDVRRQACAETGPPVRPRERQGDGVRVEYRARVPRSLLGAAVAEAAGVIAAETARGGGGPAIL